MPPEVDPAHVLFPSDTPKATQAPDWFVASHAAAEARLNGSHGRNGGAHKSDSTPSDASDNADDPARALFKDDAPKFDDSVVGNFLDAYTLGAISDGDTERADALKVATSSLAADFRAAGTDTESVKEAFATIRERNDRLVPPTPEQAAADYEAGMEAMRAELGQNLDADLNVARAFIRDLELVAPGTMASLERNGAGNDPRLIRAAIREARRRGYR